MKGKGEVRKSRVYGMGEDGKSERVIVREVKG